MEGGLGLAELGSLLDFFPVEPDGDPALLGDLARLVPPGGPVTDIKHLPLPGFPAGVLQRRGEPVQRPGVILCHLLLAGGVQDLDLVVAMDVDPAVGRPLGWQQELDMDVGVLEMLP